MDGRDRHSLVPEYGRRLALGDTEPAAAGRSTVARAGGVAFAQIAPQFSFDTMARRCSARDKNN